MASGKAFRPDQSFKRFIKTHYGEGYVQFITLKLRLNQKLIKGFRERWKIPPDGFPSLEEAKTWWNNLDKIAPELIRDVAYYEEEKYYFLRKFTFAYTRTNEELGEQPRLTVISSNAQAVFDQELKMILILLHLDPDLHLPIRDYITWGKATLDAIENTGIMVSERITSVPGFGEVERRISLNCGVNTDEDDLSDIYHHFMRSLQRDIFGFMKGKWKKQKNFEQNQAIIDQASEGKLPSKDPTKWSWEKINTSEGPVRKFIKKIRDS